MNIWMDIQTCCWMVGIGTEIAPEEIAERGWPDMWDMDNPAKFVFHSQEIDCLKNIYEFFTMREE